MNRLPVEEPTITSSSLFFTRDGGAAHNDTDFPEIATCPLEVRERIC